MKRAGVVDLGLDAAGLRDDRQREHAMQDEGDEHPGRSPGCCSADQAEYVGGATTAASPGGRPATLKPIRTGMKAAGTATSIQRPPPQALGERARLACM